MELDSETTKKEKMEIMVTMGPEDDTEQKKQLAIRNFEIFNDEPKGSGTLEKVLKHTGGLEWFSKWTPPKSHEGYDEIKDLKEIVRKMENKDEYGEHILCNTDSDDAETYSIKVMVDQEQSDDKLIGFVK
jgi:hypothetical protein